MADIIHISFSLVNTILSCLVILLVVYWIFTMLSGSDLDLDVDIDMDIDVDVDIDVDTEIDMDVGNNLELQNIGNAEIKVDHVVPKKIRNSNGGKSY